MPTKSIAKLIDAVGVAFTRAQPTDPHKWGPRPDGTTFCNEVVAFVASMMGYPIFCLPTSVNPDGAFSANQMVDRFMEQKDWMEVPGDIAQQRADEGELVVAAWKNPTGEHGHVCIVIPGEMEESSHWGKKAPKVMNVGKDVFISKGANWAFHDEPKFYILKAVS